MSVIKQISVFNGSDWSTGDIGADASNIDISSAILGSSTNVQSALTTIGNKIGTTAIPSDLGTTLTGAINTLNTNLTNKSKITSIDVYFNSSDYAKQINLITNNVVTVNNFISAYVLDTNSIIVLPYTYSNLVYVILKNSETMTNATPANYKIRIWYKI